jgi:hypothetical protein
VGTSASKISVGLPLPMTKHSEVVPNLGNQKAACAWLDLRRRQVFNLVQDGVITVDERTGLFDRDVVTVQYINYLRKERNGQLNKLPGPLEDAKERARKPNSLKWKSERRWASWFDFRLLQSTGKRW